MTKRRRGLGSPSDHHEFLAKKALNDADKALNNVEVAARKKEIGRCHAIWDYLLQAQASISYATGELDSYKAAKDDTDRYFLLIERKTRLRQTLGFQCTRRLGGIR